MNVVGAQAADHAQVPVGVDQVCRGLSEAQLLQLLLLFGLLLAELLL